MRTKLACSLVVVALIALAAVGFGSRTAAQDSATENHPLVGTWAGHVEPEETSTPHTDMFTFHADGTYVEADAEGEVDLGAWEATGADTATLTIQSDELDDDGNLLVTIKVRATIEVAADGNSFTAQYTIEAVMPDGSSSGEAGPGSVTATRLAVETPGTPVMSVEDLFRSFGPPEATPES